MKTLLYIPIIHMEPDLGSVAPHLGEVSKNIYGVERWNRHRETVSKFWDAIAQYFDGFEGRNLKVYQDGLVAGGALGLRIVEEGARRGSKNHAIVLALVKRGAEIRQTEDPELLKEEYQRIIAMTQSKSALGMGVAYLEYKRATARLTEARDRFISRRINETLRDGETGVLFLGAHHDLLPLLSKEIVVKEVKEPALVREYFDALIRRIDGPRFERLAEYLMTPVALPTIES